MLMGLLAPRSIKHILSRYDLNTYSNIVFEKIELEKFFCSIQYLKPIIVQTIVEIITPKFK
jgi:hypothetical protein